MDETQLTSQSSTEEHLDYFPFFATINQTAVNILAQMSLCACMSRDPRDEFLEEELLAPEERAFMSLVNVSKSPSKKHVTICSSTSNLGTFFFPGPA